MKGMTNADRVFRRSGDIFCLQRRRGIDITPPTPEQLKTKRRFSHSFPGFSQLKWGHSSAGRALQWHCRGRRFDPAWLHQIKTARCLASGRFAFQMSPIVVAAGGIDPASEILPSDVIQGLRLLRIPLISPPTPVGSLIGPRFLPQGNGVIAQLGERYNGIVEVRGSIPRGSTKYKTPLVLPAAFLLFLRPDMLAIRV